MDFFTSKYLPVSSIADVSIFVPPAVFIRQVNVRFEDLADVITAYSLVPAQSPRSSQIERSIHMDARDRGPYRLPDSGVFMM